MWTSLAYKGQCWMWPDHSAPSLALHPRPPPTPDLLPYLTSFQTQEAFFQLFPTSGPLQKHFFSSLFFVAWLTLTCFSSWLKCLYTSSWKRHSQDPYSLFSDDFHLFSLCLFFNYILLIMLLPLSWLFPLCPPPPSNPHSSSIFFIIIITILIIIYFLYNGYYYFKYLWVYVCI